MSETHYIKSELYHEEFLWYQKSKEKCVKFGNKSTKSFYAQTIIRRHMNKITSLKINDVFGILMKLFLKMKSKISLEVSFSLTLIASLIAWSSVTFLKLTRLVICPSLLLFPLKKLERLFSLQAPMKLPNRMGSKHLLSYFLGYCWSGCLGISSSTIDYWPH